MLAALDKGVEIIECDFSEGRVDLDCSYKGYERQEARTVPGPPIEEDVALILQTRGTTGRAKAVSMRACYQSCFRSRWTAYGKNGRFPFGIEIFSHR